MSDALPVAGMLFTPLEVVQPHAEFFERYTNLGTRTELQIRLYELADSVGAVSVNNVLTRDAEAELDELEFVDGRSDPSDHPVARGLLDVMLDISRYNVYQHAYHLTTPRSSIKRLDYTPGNPSLHTLTPPHHDFGDGNAVLYNRDVRGQHFMVVGTYPGRTIPIESNQLIVLSGQAQYLDVRGAWGTPVHSVQASPVAHEYERRNLGRARYLAYYDGPPRVPDGDLEPQPYRTGGPNMLAQMIPGA
jgi:hypothetical protein